MRLVMDFLHNKGLTPGPWVLKTHPSGQLCLVGNTLGEEQTICWADNTQQNRVNLTLITVFLNEFLAQESEEDD